MTLRPPRRIFRSQSASPRSSGRVGETVAVGLTGALIGACLMLFAAPGDLFGHAKSPYGELSAEPSQLAIVDGQTLWLNGSLVRLLGVEAPSRGKVCRKSDTSLYDCGAAAVAALSELTRGRTITCELAGRDSAGFAQGRCRAGDVDLNRGIIATGWARAAAEQVSLHDDELRARAAHLGVWSGQDNL